MNKTKAVIKLICENCGQKIKFCNKCMSDFEEGDIINCETVGHYCDSHNCERG